MTIRTLPRGIRNNNPANIRHGDKWQGLSKKQTDPAFCQFDMAEYGIRAMVKVLLTYYNKHNLRTVRGIIARWAPPNENNTEAYINAVAAEIGTGTNITLDLYNPAVMLRLCRAIIRHENGMQPYKQCVIEDGMKLAGIHGE